MKKIGLSLLIVLVVGTGIFFFWKSRHKGAESGATSPKVATAVRGPIIKVVESTGRVVSNMDVEIKSKASGEVIKLPYDISDRVKKGELVVELDPTEEQRNLDEAKVTREASAARLEKARQSLKVAESELATARRQAQIALEVAKAQAADARANEQRVRQLYEKKLASEEDYETARTAKIQAEADFEQANLELEKLKTEEEALELTRQDVVLAGTEVEKAEIALAIAEQRLKETKVFSPLDGVVTDRPIQIGQIISSGISNVGGGTALLTISDLSRIYVIASVDESDIGQVRQGQEVEITADAFADRVFAGTVDRISPRGVIESNVVTFEVKIEVTGGEKDLLKPEMTANVRIILLKTKDAVSVPIEAVGRQNGKSVVWVIDELGQKEKREVTTGVSDGLKIEIISGLDEGENVVLNSGEGNSKWRANERSGPPLGGMIRRGR